MGHRLQAVLPRVLAPIRKPFPTVLAASHRVPLVILISRAAKDRLAKTVRAKQAVSVVSWVVIA